MGELRRLEAEDIAAFVKGAAKAYPGIGLIKPDAQQTFVEFSMEQNRNVKEIHHYGYYRDGQMLGGQMYHDFTMNIHGQKMLVGGVGMVWVDLLHKKERIAKELITHFLQHYREQGAALAALYPFRPDFYKQMGFGFGTKMNEYRIKPGHFPKGASKANVQYITVEDKEDVVACYNRYAEATHGMGMRRADEWDRMFKNPEAVFVGYKQDGKVLGFMSMTFAKSEADAHFARNDIKVNEFFYETPEALSELATFLHSQADQINQVIMYTQDEYFHHLFGDPSNGSNQLLPHVYHVSNQSGVGLMYRVIDVLRLFESLEGHDFGGQSCKVKLTIRDSFLPANAGSTVVHFTEGRAQVVPGGYFEVEVSLNVEDFSALVMGSVDFKALYRYGLATVTNAEYVRTLQRLFAAESKPVCFNRF